MAQWLNWGDGSDGSPNAISGTINTYATCTGTAGQTVLTTALAASAGDQILVHQSQGTGAGTWEICKVVSDAGATLNLATALVNSYGTGAQAVLIPQYTGGTISGAVTGTSWNGTTGGIIALMCNGDLTISGSLSINGKNNPNDTRSGSTGGGFYGGNGKGTESTGLAYSGEGTVGASVKQTTANGNGGGGVNITGTGNSKCGGAGGGNGTAGYAPPNGNGSFVRPTGGSAVGNETLTVMCFGGGGGGGGVDGNGVVGGGASGGGIIFIISKNITITGTIAVNGGNGAYGFYAGGGGGAGGSVLIKCQTATLGTNKITANAGAGGGQYDSLHLGGAGGVGRIRCDYYTSVSGTTSPTLSSAQDPTLNVAAGGNFIPFFM